MWICEDCGWEGLESDLETEENGAGDLTKFCPDCESDDLRKIE